MQQKNRRRYRQAKRAIDNAIRYFAETLERRLLLSAVTWTGAGDGSNWTDPNNWSTHALPGPSDDVTINAPGSPTIQISSGTQSINSLTTSDPINLSGGTLEAATTVQLSANLTLAGGTIAGGTVTATDGASLGLTANSTLNGVVLDANLAINSGNTLTVVNGLTLNGTVSLTSGWGYYAQVDFYGSQTLDGSGQILFGGTEYGDNLFVQSPNSNVSATLTVGPGITIHGGGGPGGGVEGNASYFATIRGSVGNEALINQGTIDADASGQGIKFQYLAVTNTNTLEATNGGTLDLLNAQNQVGASIVATGAALSIDGAWNNAGSITETDSTLDLAGSFSLANLGTFNRTGGTVNLTGTLNNTNAILALDAATGSWNLDGGTIAGGTVTATDGASLGLTANSTLNGVVLDANLAINSGNTLTVVNGLTLNGTVSLTSGWGYYAQVDFYGSQTLDGSGQILFGGTEYGDNLFVQNPNSNVSATLTVGPGITIHGGGGPGGGVEGNASYFATIRGSVGNEALINQGTIDADASGQGIKFQYLAVTNTNTLEATNGGTLDLLNAQNQVGASIVATGAALSIDGAWNNAGSITETDSTLDLAGSFSLANLGTFNRTGGTVNLTGTLNNTNAILALDAATGSWNLDGGTIAGGTVTATDGASLGLTANSTLNGVVLDANLAINSGNTLTVVNGLTLNGTVSLTSGWGYYAQVDFYGSQTLDGSGQILFGGTEYGDNLFVQSPNSNVSATLTVGPGITIHGGGGPGGGVEGNASYFATIRGSVGNEALINQGTIDADASGQGIKFQYLAVTNTNTLEATNGGTLNLGSIALTNNGVVLADAATLAINAYNGNGILDLTGAASLDVSATLTLSGLGLISSTSYGTVQLAANLLGNTQNSHLFDLQGAIIFTGSGTSASPQFLEAMSQDDGPVSSGFTNNFDYATLALANNTYLKLVNLSHNSPGTGNEAVYANTLIVPSGCTLDLNGLNLYTRAAQIDGTVVNGSVTQIPNSGALTLNSSAPGFIGTAGQLDAWTFYGRAGEVITAMVNPGGGGSPAPISPQLDWANVQLLDPSGDVLQSSSSASSGAAATLGAVTLPVDGVYTLDVNAPAGHASSTGHYVISAYDATPNVSALSLNQIVTGTIDTPYATDQWTFSASAGAQVQFDLANVSNSALTFSLTGPGGFTAFSNATGSSGSIDLPSSGTYTISVSSGGNGTGSYAFEMNQTSVTPLALNGTDAGTLSGTGASQIFSIDVPSAQVLSVQLADANAGDSNELYLKFGAPPTLGDYDYSFSSPGNNQSILVPSATTGTWYALVYARNLPSSANFTLSDQASAVTITGVTPNQATNTAPFTVSVSGAGFATGAAVSLLAADGVTTYAPTSTSVDSFTGMTAVFPTSVPAGQYAVEVTSNGATATLPEAITIAAGQPNLVTKLIMPPTLGRHALATLYLEYSNTGNAPMPAPLIEVGSTNANSTVKPILTLDPSQVATGLWNSTGYAPGFGSSVTLLASGAQPGILAPGESMVVPIYYCGLLQPWDFSQTTVQLGTAIVQADDSRVMNWAGVTYAVVETAEAWYYPAEEINGKVIPGSEGTSTSYQTEAFAWSDGQPPTDAELDGAVGTGTSSTSLIDSVGGTTTTVLVYERYDEPGFTQLKPAGYTDAAWAAVLSNLEATVGDTLGDYVQALDDNAAYLARQGVVDNNISDLWGLSVLEASGAAPAASLGAITDISLPTPGVTLSFSRSFNNTIEGRYSFGPMGYGWDDNWDMHLTANADGSVTISNASGPLLTYSPDSRTAGAFFSQPGDTNTLFGLGNGVYQLEDAHGNITSFLADGDIDYVQDSDGNRVTCGYNAAGQLISLTHSNGEWIAIGYNAAGLIALVSDSGGDSTTFNYDPTNQYLMSTVTADGKITSYTYQTSGAGQIMNALLSITAGGTTRTFGYDSEGRLNTTYLGNDQQAVTLGYDNMGTVSIADAFGTTDLFYGQFGQLLKTQDPLGNITSAKYDSDGDLTSLALPNGASEAFTWDSHGDLTSVTDEAGNKTTFAYDNQYNELTSFTDANHNTTHYAYDADGNLLSTTYPNNSTESYSGYTSAGLPATFTDQAGQPINYVYNAAGQVTQETFADGSNDAFTYDARGNVLTAVETAADGTSTTATYSYNYSTDGDRLDKVTYSDGRYLVYTYDEYGRETSITDQTGYSTVYDYDSAGNLWHVRDGSGNLLATYTYDAAGRLSRIDKGNGTFTTYTYDAAGNILSLQNWQNATTLDSEFVYTYNSLGQRTSMTTLDGTWTYAYDSVGELVHAVLASTNPAIPGEDLVYNYDAVGNRTSTVINGVTTQYTANNLNEYTSVGGVGYQYDANGNLIFDGTNTYTYNQQNQLISVSGPSGVTQYEYDAFGNRTASIVNGVRTEYLNDPTTGNVVGEYDGNGNVIAQNSYGLGLVDQTTEPATNYFDFDSNGSTADITNATGSVISQYTYLPFGGLLSFAGANSNPWQFSGQYGVFTDADGAIFVKARYLDTTIGSFMSTDSRTPFLGGDTNGYRYALNAPTIDIDIDGHQAVESEQQQEQEQETFDTEAGVPDAPFNDTVNGALARLTAEQLSELRERWELNDRLSAAYYHRNYYDAIITQPGTVVSPDDFLRPYPKWYYDSLNLPLLPLVNPQDSSFSTSFDPNSLTGPSGYGSQNFISDSTAIPYRVAFENIGPGSVDADGNPYTTYATAPAQRVTITDQLSSNLDWSTFQLGEAGFGDTVIQFPADAQSYTGEVSVTIDGNTFDVQVQAGINLATGNVYCTFQSIDPLTNLPPSVLIGFLPPEDGTGDGKGYFSYTVLPKVGLATGTQIQNVALISFDGQPRIATDQVNDQDPTAGVDPTKEALATIDSVAPTSTVAALPPNTPFAAFPVTWSGTDDAGGSGIASYNIYVSTNGGPFSEWLANTTNTASLFAGQAGNTYSFYSVATDNVGNVEPMPTAAQATTTVGTVVSGLPAWLDPNSHATWDATTQTLTITGSATITADPAATGDLPNIIADGAAAQLLIDVPAPADVHIGGLTLTNGATVDLKQEDVPDSTDQSIGEAVGASHASDHNVLVVGSLGATMDPTFSVDAASTLNLEDNDLIIHNGSSDVGSPDPSSYLNSSGYADYAIINALVKTGRDSGAWDGKGITSSIAAAQDTFDGVETVQLAVVNNADLQSPFGYEVPFGNGTTGPRYTVGSAAESVGPNDTIVKYTYTGDLDLNGKVDTSDSALFGLFYDGGASTGEGWAFGDMDGNGKIDTSDSATFGLLYGDGTSTGVDQYQL